MPEPPYDRTTDLDRTNPTRRRGSTVTHPAQPWTPTVHAFLRHLAAEGFDAAPRVVGSGWRDAAPAARGRPLVHAAARRALDAVVAAHRLARRGDQPRQRRTLARGVRPGAPGRSTASSGSRSPTTVGTPGCTASPASHGDAEGLWTLAWQSRAALWTLEHRDLLTRTAMR
jgi:hypothetical protein